MVFEKKSVGRAAAENRLGVSGLVPGMRTILEAVGVWICQKQSGSW
jgi:hypothetical protein